ncbi:hypothetical protein KW782_04950, partial [Candidatus Parcubacteria bacterium]|nr:hypothetical protein [Candidatus Parcubacteria bacterium]
MNKVQQYILLILSTVLVGFTILTLLYIQYPENQTAAVIGSLQTFDPTAQRIQILNQQITALLGYQAPSQSQNIVAPSPISQLSPQPSPSVSQIPSASPSVSSSPSISPSPTLNPTPSATPQPLVGDLRALVLERKDLMLQLAEKDPEAFLVLSLTNEVRNRLPYDLQQHVESDVDVANSEISTFHVDDFDHPENSKFNYSLLVDDVSNTTNANVTYLTLSTAENNKKELKFFPTAEAPLPSGTKLNVKGKQLTNVVVAKNANIFAGPLPPPEATGNQKTAI